MHPVIESKKADLEIICLRFHVSRLEVFGSATTNRFDPSRSDVDLLVEFEPLGPESHANDYFGLLEALESLFDRPVDLVSAKAIRNPYFAASVNATRQTIYAA